MIRSRQAGGGGGAFEPSFQGHLVLQAELGHQAAGCRLVLAENTEQALPDDTRLLAGVNSLPDAGLLVVVDNWAGLLVVG